METNQSLHDLFIEKLSEKSPLVGAFIRVIIGLGQSNRQEPNKEEYVLIKAYVDNVPSLSEVELQMEKDDKAYYDFYRLWLTSGMIGYCMPFLTNEQFINVRRIVNNVIYEPDYYKKIKNGAES
jgi:hypothetical protein